MKFVWLFVILYPIKIINKMNKFKIMVIGGAMFLCSLPIMSKKYFLYSTIDREYFKENIMNWFQDFQDAHKDIDGYNDELESDYEWSWDDFFDFLGL